jgi:hypothetical protein
MENAINVVKGMLAGDGNAYDRMNAVEFGQGISEYYSKAAEYCRKKGITINTLEESIKSDIKLKRMFYALSKIA